MRGVALAIKEPRPPTEGDDRGSGQCGYAVPTVPGRTLGAIGYRAV